LAATARGTGRPAWPVVPDERHEMERAGGTPRRRRIEDRRRTKRESQIVRARQTTCGYVSSVRRTGRTSPRATLPAIHRAGSQLRTQRVPVQHVLTTVPGRRVELMRRGFVGGRRGSARRPCLGDRQPRGRRAARRRGAEGLNAHVAGPPRSERQDGHHKLDAWNVARLHLERLALQTYRTVISRTASARREDAAEEGREA